MKSIRFALALLISLAILAVAGNALDANTDPAADGCIGPAALSC